MEKIVLTPYLIKMVNRQIEAKCAEVLRDEGLELATGKGPAKFGFREFHESPNSIRGVMLKNDKVFEHIKLFYKNQSRRTKKNLTTKLIRESFNGKYLYNRLKEAEKNKPRIELSGLYAKIYFIFLGCNTLENFLEEHQLQISTLEKEKQKKISVIDNDEISQYAISFLAYYFSYRENSIKKFLIEIDHLNEMKVRQTGFHYTSFSKGGSFDHFVNEGMDQTKIYNGKAVGLKNTLHINLEGEKDGGTDFMNILLYKGGMNISEMQIVRGSINTMSAHGYIFSAEIFLRKILKTPNESTIELLADKYDEGNSNAELIKRYLFFQRRTYRIPANTEQELEKMTAKRFGLNEIDSMIGVWKIWGLDQKNRILQSKLIVKKDLSAYLFTNSDRNDTRQLCILRLSKGRNGLNLWISAHQEYGTELRNVAVIDVPEYTLKKSEVITTGVAIGLGVVKPEFSHSPIVLMKLSQDNFKSKQMKPIDVSEAVENDPVIHGAAFKKLKKMARKRNRAQDHFHTYIDLLKAQKKSYGNSDYE